jgi:hypothetical protein
MSESRSATLITAGGLTRPAPADDEAAPSLGATLGGLKRKLAGAGRLPFVAEHSGERFDLYAVMTLLLLLLYSSELWHVRLVATVLSVLAFVFSSLRRSAKFWFVVAATVLIGNWQQWAQMDNHKYLLGYWCFAFFCALQTEETEKTLATAARCLIGLSFLFAVFWKVTSGDFLDGSFFQHALLTDDRFAHIARVLGGLTVPMERVNAAAREALVNYDSRLTSVQLLTTAGVASLAKFLTWWTLLIEALVAVTFLWPAQTKVSDSRDFFLLIFILSTYAVAAVIGFGWVLVIMGLAQCAGRFRYMRLAYVLAFVILQVYRFRLGAIW